MNVTLDVERLVLDGIELRRGDESRLRAMIESELARLFAAEAPAMRSSPAMASLDGGVIHTGAPAGTAGLAREIAGAVHRALCTGRDGTR